MAVTIATRTIIPTIVAKKEFPVFGPANRPRTVIGNTIAPGSMTYLMRGWDTGSGGRNVYWTATDPASAPTSTSPAVTGTLQNKQIVGLGAA